MAASKDLKRLVKTIEQQGYTVVKAGSGHLKIKNETGGTVYTLPSTPGKNNRSMQNTISQLRRLGVIPKNYGR